MALPFWKQDGILNFYKPVGVTSHDCVHFVRRFFQIDKVGHGGTLDPFAEGVLPLGINKGTKALESFLQGQKEYLGQIRLGVLTDTLDSEGQILKTQTLKPDAYARFVARIPLWMGSVAQKTPQFSARKIKGQRLYKRARKQFDPDLQTIDRQIQIFDLQTAMLENGDFSLKVLCSKGTYIRQLAQDLIAEEDLGCLWQLKRLAVAELKIEDSIGAETLAHHFLNNNTEGGVWFHPL